jgi:hypothetical protein
MGFLKPPKIVQPPIPEPKAAPDAPANVPSPVDPAALANARRRAADEADSVSSLSVGRVQAFTERLKQARQGAIGASGVSTSGVSIKRT